MSCPACGTPTDGRLCPKHWAQRLAAIAERIERLGPKTTVGEGLARDAQPRGAG